ncbi:MAG: ubiquinone/menaquinone biosynthesis methyltransferase [Gemmatimonadota bacterium]
MSRTTLERISSRRARARIGSQIADPGDKRRYVRALFTRVARRYDLTNDAMSLGLHRRWKKAVVELAGIRSDDVVLDLAAGTGDLALRAARGSRPPHCVIAGDLTAAMLHKGRRRSGAQSVRWLQCDAIDLPFRDGSVDRVLIGYGLRNFSELDRCLAEIRRCLRPGGRLVSLDFGRADPPFLHRLYLRYLSLCTATAGWLLHRDAESYLYIPESLKRYPAQEGVAAMMQRAGFVRCGYVDFLFGTMAINFGDREG